MFDDNTAVPRARRRIFSDRDLWLLIALAAAKLAFHLATNGQYGFHRDELQTLSDSHHLDWGFVAYPPLTPFFAHVEWLLFGNSLIGFRSFAAMAQSIVFVVTGLIARRLGGGRAAMLLAAFAVALSPVSLSASSLLMYVTFDFLCFVLLAYFVVRRIESGDARWWIAIGAIVGVGMMTKYTMAFFALGLVAGVFLTPLRADLRGKWPWLGLALAVLVFLPNLLWLARHDFITLTFLQFIHARDVRIGRTGGFWIDQIKIAANFATVPFWLAGLWFLFFAEAGRRWRILGWMAVVPCVIFVFAKGRGYYAAPLYPMLIAAGSVQWQHWLDRRSLRMRRVGWAASAALLLCGLVVLRACLPLAAVNSPHWALINELNGDFREEFGWPELTREVARIWNSLTPAERAQGGLWVSNYGEAGALELYGPQYGLPPVISAVNSFWLRGPPAVTPQTLVVVGSQRRDLEKYCTSVELAGHTGNDAHVANEETERHPDIFVCRGPIKPLDAVWPKLLEFG
jgi:4-amino-4-deoxy-L-arabinose transferase-like glycosyltransferase